MKVNELRRRWQRRSILYVQAFLWCGLNALVFLFLRPLFYSRVWTMFMVLWFAAVAGWALYVGVSEYREAHARALDDAHAQGMADALDALHLGDDGEVIVLVDDKPKSEEDDHANS